MIPPRVTNVEDYWNDPPPDRSPRCQYWVNQITRGWRPNRRIRALGYYSSAEWYGVWIWEYLNVLRPQLRQTDD